MCLKPWFLAGLVLSLCGVCAQAYESDVHYGLTKWLARQAGFDDSQSDWIAVADQRVDGGLMDTMELALEYACAGRFTDVAQQAQRRHFPSTTPVPAAPAQRTVVPGSTEARAALSQVMKQAPGKEGLMLVKLGEALHTLQDSWSHQGVPEAPSKSAAGCDPSLYAGHAAARGGADAHDADLTHLYAADALAMARATYEALKAYPRIQGRARHAADWEVLVPPLQQLLKSSTKTAKRDWFVAQGITDTSFLEGTSLADGPKPGPLSWAGHKLPPVPEGGSTQHEIDPTLRAFFDSLLARWLGPEPVDTVVAELGPDVDDAPRAARQSPAARQLAARLKAWKLKDHGTVAALAHAASPLSAAQLRSIDRLAQDGKAFVSVGSLAEAVFPLQRAGPLASPLVPYIVSPAHSSEGRFMAIARLRHAPYDSVGWVAEKRAGRWALVDVVSVVNH